MIALSPAAAASQSPQQIDPARAYVSARAAAISGDHSTAAQIYARLAATSPDAALTDRAVAEAINAGNTALALQLIRSAPKPAGSIDAQLLLVADALRSGRLADAQALLNAPGRADLAFWAPLVQAWIAAERRDAAGALTLLSSVPQNSAFGAFTDEQAALILLKLGRTAEAEPYARRALEKAGPRAYRLRLALAAGFEAARDRTRALAMLEGLNGNGAAIRRKLEGGDLDGVRIDSASEAFSEQLIALASEMRRSNPRNSPVSVLQIARHAAPESSSAAILLGSMLNSVDRPEDALAVLRTIPSSDPLHADSLDVQTRVLIGEERLPEALAVASKATQSSSASADDFARLGDVYSAMDRHNEAASAYAQAIARAAGRDPDRLWPLYLLQASALESADRWPEAKAALSRGLQLAPDQPLLLNFLGYAMLERGEDLDTAEAMIRKASALDPENASITDSLGWALYKRGRTDEAIALLQQAAMGDPAQAEIHEHLGDVLYTAGRRFEARFAWQAALATADEEAVARLKSKIESGLSPASAAP